MGRTKAAERWRGLLRDQAGSGLSIAEFCRRRGVSQPSFYQWRKRLQNNPPDQAAFLPLSVVGGAAVEVELPGGAVVRIPPGDERTLEQVIRLLTAGREESS